MVELSRQLDVHAHPIEQWQYPLLEGAVNVFYGARQADATPDVCVKTSCDDQRTDAGA